MKNAKALLLTVMLLAAGTVAAQYKQDRPNVEFMLKVEAGLLHNVGNFGQPAVEATSPYVQGTGYNLNAHEEGMGLNVMAGINISQDFFLGGGLGYAYCMPRSPLMGGNSQMALAFVDLDFRPVGDIWAPMIGARVGGSYLMNPSNYGNTTSSYLELYGGLNWFYDHALQQMYRNYHSFYAEVGIVLVQQTLFIPVRVGWRL